MRQLRPSLILFLSLLLSSAAKAQGHNEKMPAMGPIVPEKAHPVFTNYRQRSSPPGVDSRVNIPEVKLPPLSDAEQRRLHQHGTAQQVVTGITRRISVESIAVGTWIAGKDGKPVWVLKVSSPNATGLRLHFVGFSVADGRVWVSAGPSNPAHFFGRTRGAACTAMGTSGRSSSF
jgi:hypothetical protein